MMPTSDSRQNLKDANLAIDVAPMLDWTDAYARLLYRIIHPQVGLYSEMITTGALLHGQKERLLWRFDSEGFCTIQLGGSDPKDLALCAKMVEDWGYGAINLNLGCPSPRVQKGSFGACLMKEPDLVAECLHQMQQSCNLPISIKTRLGLGKSHYTELLPSLIEKTHKAGCNHFVIHARNAWLEGLSPKENRDIPPLDYEAVYQIKKDYPNLTIVINGGIEHISEVAQHNQKVDGSMIGREIYHNPWILAQAQEYTNSKPLDLSRETTIQTYLMHLHHIMPDKHKASNWIKPLLGLYKGCHLGKHWRRFLTETVARSDSPFKELYGYLDRQMDFTEDSINE
jgi:tRNA-dihydrouridine synthase A